MEKSDFFSGIALLVFGAAIFIGSLNYPFGEMNNPGPGFVPRILSLILIVNSLFIIISAYKKYRGGKGGVARETFFPHRMLLACVFLLGYRLLFPILSFIPTTALFLLLVPRLLGDFGWKTSFIFSFLSTFTAYLLFQVLLKIQMPVGIFS